MSKVRPSRGAPAHDPSEVDMTPMIDMTFQLIAFFMLLVNFTEAEVNPEVKLPRSELAKPPDAPPNNPLTLQVASDGKVLMSGDRVEVANLQTYLDRERQALVALGQNASDALVIIRAHMDAPTGKVQDIIQECQKARFEKFALRAEEDK